jgi:hypothetical protein
MIQWASRLYIGDKIMKKKDKAITSINNRRLTYDVYCITLASNSGNLFDIMNANELLFPHYQKTNVKIVGLAKGREEAISLVRDMIMEIYENTGSFNVREYFA